MEKLISLEKFNSLFWTTYQVLDQRRIELKLIPKFRIIKFVDLEQLIKDRLKENGSDFSFNEVFQKLIEEEAYEAFLNEIEK